MVLCDSQIEELGIDVVRKTGLDPAAPVDPLRLAQAVVGPVIELPSRGLPPEVSLCKVHGQRRIYVRGELSPKRLAWALLHETAEAVLEAHGYDQVDAELVANRLAASLGAPLPFAERACTVRGPRWQQLSLDFGATQSCAALRYGEVTGNGVALVTPREVRYRGDWFGDEPSEEALRRGRARNVVKARLRDDPSRFVFRSKLAS